MTARGENRIESHDLYQFLCHGMKTITWLAIFTVLALTSGIMGLLLTCASSQENNPAPPGPFPGNQSKGIMLAASFPPSPETAAVYRMTKHTVFSFGGPEIMDIRENIPTEEEAPRLATQALAQYGGLPGDAVLARVERVTVKQYNLATGAVEAEFPQYTAVIWRQQAAGHPVVGPGAGITVGLGEDGEVLQVEKVWRSLEYDHEIPIISAEDAFEKLERRELVKIPQCSLDGLHVSDIRLGYYAEDRDYEQEFFLPVWIFYGTLHPEIDQTLYPFIVDAVRDEVPIE